MLPVGRLGDHQCRDLQCSAMSIVIGKLDLQSVLIERSLVARKSFTTLGQTGYISGCHASPAGFRVLAWICYGCLSSRGRKNLFPEPRSAAAGGPHGVSV